MKTLFFVFISILLSQSIIAQSLEVDSNQMKKIDGFFHPYKKTFVYEKLTPHPDEDAYVKYYAENFIANRAIVHRQELFYTKTYNNATKQYEEISHKQSSYGVIDTLGNIIMPCAYGNLRRIPYDSYSKYFITYTEDSISLINCSGKKLFTLCQICKDETLITNICLNSNYVRVRYCSKYYLFDINKESFVLPTKHINNHFSNEIENEEYQMVNSNKRFAIFCNIPYTLDFDDIQEDSLRFDLYGSNINYIVFDLLHKEFSNPHQLAGLYNDSLVYFQDSVDSSWVTNNVKAPINIYDYDYIEAFPENPYSHSFNKEFDYWHKAYKDYLLVSKDGKYGIIRFDNHILIPTVYDNIYLLIARIFGLKRMIFGQSVICLTTY